MSPRVSKTLQGIYTRSNGTKWPLGPVLQGALLGLTLYTGVVSISKAPVLDTSDWALSRSAHGDKKKAPVLDTLPAGAVEGLIGAGPLMALKNLSQIFPKNLLKTFHRSSRDLPQIPHRSSTDLQLTKTKKI